MASANGRHAMPPMPLDLLRRRSNGSTTTAWDGPWTACLWPTCPSLVLAVATHVVQEFGVSLDELHNDSTTVSFCGAYTRADGQQRAFGRPTLAITFGHNKDHRPDLKQLLFILTVTADGGVPLHFRAESGNVTDDQTHRETWDLLCQLTGRRDFLYVADCKLATSENMAYLHQRQGRFVTVLPRTRSEDAAFRAAWWPRAKSPGNRCGRRPTKRARCSIATPPATNRPRRPRATGWSGITARRKAEQDAVARSGRIERALKELAALRAKLRSPRTRYRQEAKVAAAVAEILENVRGGELDRHRSSAADRGELSPGPSRAAA